MTDDPEFSVQQALLQARQSGLDRLDAQVLLLQARPLAARPRLADRARHRPAAGRGRAGLRRAVPAPPAGASRSPT